MKTRKLKNINYAQIQKELVEDLFRQGHPVIEIAELTSLSHEAIETILTNAGIVKKKKNLSHEEKEKLIARLFKKGKTTKQIAIELHLKRNMVTNILRKLNFITHKRVYAGLEFTSSDTFEAFRKKLGEKIRQEYKNGKTIPELILEHKISRDSVLKFLKKLSSIS
ncbi:MAG: hypothetical protein ABI855_12295 [Bacteroidota bacterium]